MQVELESSKMDLINSIVQFRSLARFPFHPWPIGIIFSTDWYFCLRDWDFMGVISTFHQWLTGSKGNETIGRNIRNSNAGLCFRPLQEDWFNQKCNPCLSKAISCHLFILNSEFRVCILMHISIHLGQSECCIWRLPKRMLPCISSFKKRPS